MRLIDAISLKKRIGDKLLSAEVDNDLNHLRQEFVSSVCEIIDQSEVITIEKIIVPKLSNDNAVWYDVKEKMPPNHSSVLCYFIYDDGSGAMAENHYHGRGKWLSDGKHVAFWRELPDLPEAVFDGLDEYEPEIGDGTEDDFGEDEEI